MNSQSPSRGWTSTGLAEKKNQIIPQTQTPPPAPASARAAPTAGPRAAPMADQVQSLRFDTAEFKASGWLRTSIINLMGSERKEICWLLSRRNSSQRELSSRSASEGILMDIRLNYILFSRTCYVIHALHVQRLRPLLHHLQGGTCLEHSSCLCGRRQQASLPASLNCDTVLKWQIMG